MPAGVVTVIVVLFKIIIFVAEAPPIVTAAPGTNPVPTIVMLSPPTVVPEDGEILVIVGDDTPSIGTLFTTESPVKLASVPVSDEVMFPAV